MQFAMHQRTQEVKVNKHNKRKSSASGTVKVNIHTKPKSSAHIYILYSDTVRYWYTFVVDRF